ncbi:unnamed protein product, partial [Ectocarpus fasciculatus]
MADFVDVKPDLRALRRAQRQQPRRRRWRQQQQQQLGQENQRGKKRAAMDKREWTEGLEIAVADTEGAGGVPGAEACVRDKDRDPKVAHGMIENHADGPGRARGFLLRYIVDAPTACTHFSFSSGGRAVTRRSYFRNDARSKG